MAHLESEYPFSQTFYLELAKMAHLGLEYPLPLGQWLPGLGEPLHTLTRQGIIKCLWLSSYSVEPL